MSSFSLVFWVAGLVAEDGHTWWGGRIDTVAFVDVVDAVNLFDYPKRLSYGTLGCKGQWNEQFNYCMIKAFNVMPRGSG